jgi:hypothetical protein
LSGNRGGKREQQHEQAVHCPLKTLKARAEFPSKTASKFWD